MEPANAAKIDSHFDYIVQNMDTYSTLKNLLENRTLSSENHQRIGRITLSVDANQELLKVLKETPGAYEKFIDALNESKQFQLVQTLQTMSAPAPLSSPEAEEGQSPTEDPITTPLPSHEKKAASSLASETRKMKKVVHIDHDDVAAVVRQSLVHACYNLDTKTILVSLLNGNFLTDVQVQVIKAKKVKFDRNSKFLEILPKLNHGALEYYMQALYNSNQHKLLENIWFNSKLPHPLRNMCIAAVYQKCQLLTQDELRSKCIAELGADEMTKLMRVQEIDSS